MRISVILTLLVSLFFIQGCYSKKIVWSNTKIKGDRVILLDAERNSWMGRIERTLRQNGYIIVRVDDTNLKVDYHPPVRVYVDGYARLDAMRKCFGGGFYFEDIYVEVINTATDETLASYEGSGYSEDCPPAYGNTFRSVFETIDSVWDIPLKRNNKNSLPK